MQNKKTILLVIVLAVGGIMLMSWGRAPSVDSRGVAALGVTAATLGEKIPEFDFGFVSMVKGKVAHDFELRNSTDSDIKITRAESSCMCTEVLLKMQDGKEYGPFGMPGHGFVPAIEVVVKPGEKVTAHVVFDPAAHGPSGIGVVQRLVVLYTDKGQYNYNFRAEVTP